MSEAKNDPLESLVNAVKGLIDALPGPLEDRVMTMYSVVMVAAQGMDNHTKIQTFLRMIERMQAGVQCSLTVRDQSGREWTYTRDQIEPSVGDDPPPSFN